MVNYKLLSFAGPVGFVMCDKNSQSLLGLPLTQRRRAICDGISRSADHEMNQSQHTHF